MYEEEATYMYEEEDTYMPITDGAFEGNNIFLRERMLTTAGHIYCSRTHLLQIISRCKMSPTGTK